MKDIQMWMCELMLFTTLLRSLHVKYSTSNIVRHDAHQHHCTVEKRLVSACVFNNLTVTSQPHYCNQSISKDAKLLQDESRLMSCKPT